jgi:hypothetical protein
MRLPTKCLDDFEPPRTVGADHHSPLRTSSYDWSFDAMNPEVGSVVRVLNILGAAIAAAFAIAALLNPAMNIGNEPVTAGVTLYAALYAVRQLAVSLVLSVGMVRGRRATVVALLLAAGFSQVGDVMIGVLTPRPSLIAGALALVAIHLGSALWLRRSVGMPEPHTVA